MVGRLRRWTRQRWRRFLFVYYRVRAELAGLSADTARSHGLRSLYVTRTLEALAWGTRSSRVAFRAMKIAAEETERTMRRAHFLLRRPEAELRGDLRRGLRGIYHPSRGGPGV